MNWKKILKYTLMVMILGTVVLVILANRNMTQIYGGLTEVVDYNQFKVKSNDVWIYNVNILSQDGNAFIPNQNVLIENGIITLIDTLTMQSKEIHKINGTGKFLIPGLIDSHVHLFKSQNDLLLYVANGVTGIRELIGEEAHLEWREEIRNGRIGPDMYIASPRLGSFGALEGFFMSWSQGFNNIRDTEEAKSKVKEYAEQGYDAVKIYSYLNKEAFEAVNRVAIEEGLDVVGHVPFDLTIMDVLNSNQSDIAHLEELMNAFRREYGDLENQEGADKFIEYAAKRTEEIAPLLIKNDISVTTTLWLTKSFVRQKFELDKILEEVELVHENPGISEWDKMIPQGLGWLPEVNRYKLNDGLSDEDRAWIKIFWTTYGDACQVILTKLAETGVKILAGTDTNLPPTVPGFSLHDELISMNNAGMTPSQVLQSATSIPANRMGHNSGKMEEGFKANLVLLEANPLDNISNTRKINTVFLNGKVLDRTKLDQMLDAVKKANDASRKVSIDQYTAGSHGHNH
ncbi:MAG: amidohydrolase family protein [Cyclobacteriaceae bacterium]